MSDNKQFDFTTFVSSNLGGNASGFDYLHTVYKSQDLPPDFIVWFSKLFWPNFEIKDGLIFISELFNAEHFQQMLNEGHSTTQAQFWTNLLEITGLFDGLSFEQATVIAEALAKCWNSKLQLAGGDHSTPARTLYDEETGEVFLTIGAPD